MIARLNKNFNDQEDDEFLDDFKIEELETISESEKFDTSAETRKEANKVKSQQSAENI